MTQKRESQSQKQRRSPSSLFGLASGGFFKPPGEGIFGPYRGQSQSIAAAFGDAFGGPPKPRQPDLLQFEESELRTALVRLQEIYKYLEKIKRIVIEIPPSMLVNDCGFNAEAIDGSKKLVLEDIKHITEAITHKMSGETDGDKCPETAE